MHSCYILLYLSLHRVIKHEQLVCLWISHFCCWRLIKNIAHCGYLGDLLNTNICHCVVQATIMIASRPFSSASKFRASTKGICDAFVDAGMMHFPPPPKWNFPAPPRSSTFGAGGAVAPCPTRAGVPVRRTMTHKITDSTRS